MRDVTKRALLSTAVLLCGALLLTGCSSGPDAEATRDAFTEVTEAPENLDGPDDATEYDAELHPDPIVEPLECKPYLVVTGRGTSEPTKGQLLSPVARSIAEARPDEVQTLDLDYPANTDVRGGGTQGARVLVDTLNVQTEECPEQRFVLLGYSQGALVIGDALSDPEVRVVGELVGEVSQEALDRILAVVFYGDPRFVGTEKFAFGDYDPGLNGILPRPPGALDGVADRLRDYCVAGDFVCQSTLEVTEEPHMYYFTNGMQHDGAAFVITRLDPPQKKADDEEKKASEDSRDGEPDSPDAE
ncbi:MAG: cutinase family protein [Leucobacter sp.]